MTAYMTEYFMIQGYWLVGVILVLLIFATEARWPWITIGLATTLALVFIVYGATTFEVICGILLLIIQPILAFILWRERRNIERRYHDPMGG
jgi:hypothetical protein